MTAILTSLFRRHCSLLYLLVSVVLLATWQLPALAQVAAPRLSSDSQIATTGFHRLSWKTDRPGRVGLQEVDNPNFTAARDRYVAPDRASVISGMTDGKWYYRMRGAERE